MLPVLTVAPGFVRIVGKQCDLVALRVAKVADVKVRSIRGTKAGLALVSAACGKRGGVKRTNLLLTARLECDHDAVPGRGRTSIEGWLDVEIRQDGRLAGMYGQRAT